MSTLNMLEQYIVRVRPNSFSQGQVAVSYVSEADAPRQVLRAVREHLLVKDCHVHGASVAVVGVVSEGNTMIRMGHSRMLLIRR